LSVEELECGGTHLQGGPSDLLLLDQVQLVSANVFQPTLVWRLVEVPCEVRHCFDVRTDRLLGTVPQSKIIDHSLTQFRHERALSLVSFFTYARPSVDLPRSGLVQQPFRPNDVGQSSNTAHSISREAHVLFQVNPLQRRAFSTTVASGPESGAHWLSSLFGYFDVSNGICKARSDADQAVFVNALF
jgi:hypothetical protein